MILLIHLISQMRPTAPPLDSRVARERRWARPFHPRCPKFMEGECDVTEPELTPVAEGHVVRCLLYSEPGGEE